MRHCRKLFLMSLAASLWAMPAYATIDLEVQSVNVQVQSAAVGRKKAVTVVSQIRNNGSEEASGFSVSVTVRRQGKVIRTINDVPVLSKLPRMAAGLSFPVNIGEFDEGEYEAAATVQGPFEETRDDNNTSSRTFRVSRTTYSGSYSSGGY